MHPSPLEFILSKSKDGVGVCMLPSWFDKLTMTNSGACPEPVELSGHLSIPYQVRDKLLNSLQIM